MSVFALSQFRHAPSPCRKARSGESRFAQSFRAECPAPLFLREAPGHAVEESLFDRPTPSGGRQRNVECRSLPALLVLTQEGSFEGLPPSQGSQVDG